MEIGELREKFDKETLEGIGAGAAAYVVLVAISYFAIGPLTSAGIGGVFALLFAGFALYSVGKTNTRKKALFAASASFPIILFADFFFYSLLKPLSSPLALVYEAFRKTIMLAGFALISGFVMEPEKPLPGSKKTSENKHVPVRHEETIEPVKTPAKKTVDVKALLEEKKEREEKPVEEVEEIVEEEIIEEVLPEETGGEEKGRLAREFEEELLKEGLIEKEKKQEEEKKEEEKPEKPQIPPEKLAEYQQAANMVETERKRGKSDKEIREKLAEAGYAEEEIKQIIEMAEK